MINDRSKSSLTQPLRPCQNAANNNSQQRKFFMSGNMESIRPVLTTPRIRRQHSTTSRSISFKSPWCVASAYSHGRCCILDLSADVIYLRFDVVVLSVHRKRSLMHLSSHRTNFKMALATTEPYFPIVLKTKDARRAEPMNPSAFLFRCSRTPA